MRNSWPQLNWFQKLQYIGFILILLFVILNFVPIKSGVSQSVEGVQWVSGDSETHENVVVTLEGKYVRYVFHLFHKEDYFEGKITVSNYDFTLKDSVAMQKVLFNRTFGKTDSGGELQYIVFDEKAGTYGEVAQKNYVLGRLYQRQRMSQGVILVSNTVCDIEETVMIAYPCERIEEAFRCVNELLPYNGEL